MNNLAMRQLAELGILVAAACVYITMHYATSGIAVLISGKKTGVIRGFVQGLLLVGVLAAAVIFFFDGNLKVYHVLTYFGLDYAVIKLLVISKNKIAQARPHKSNEQQNEKNIK